MKYTKAALVAAIALGLSACGGSPKAATPTPTVTVTAAPTTTRAPDTQGYLIYLRSGNVENVTALDTSYVELGMAVCEWRDSGKSRDDYVTLVRANGIQIIDAFVIYDGAEKYLCS